MRGKMELEEIGENEFAQMRKEESQRILERIKDLRLRERHLYLEAYADALKYARRFLDIKDSQRKLFEHLP
jgi:hypothetical protein